MSTMETFVSQKCVFDISIQSHGWWVSQTLQLLWEWLPSIPIVIVVQSMYNNKDHECQKWSIMNLGSWAAGCSWLVSFTTLMGVRKHIWWLRVGNRLFFVLWKGLKKKKPPFLISIVYSLALGKGQYLFYAIEMM